MAPQKTNMKVLEQNIDHSKKGALGVFQFTAKQIFHHGPSASVALAQ